MKRRALGITHREPVPLPEDEPFQHDLPHPVPQDEPVQDPNPECG